MNIVKLKNRLRMRHIDCFVAVAAERHLGRAAASLSLSQPAMSKTVAELEEIVGVRLFERGRHGAVLTHSGELFLTHAVSVRQALDAAKNAVGAELRPQTQVVHIGALPTVAPDLLPLTLRVFQRNHPAARVTIQTAANAPLLDKLKSGEVDFVLGRISDPYMMVGLSFELLYVEPLIVVVRNGHPLCSGGASISSAVASAITLKEVMSFPLIVFAKGTIPRHSTESYFQARGYRLPENRIETMSVSVARSIASQSDSIWFTPVGAVRDDLAKGVLARLAISTEGTEESVGLLQRSEGVLSALAQEFIRIVRDIAVAQRQGIQRM